MADWSFRVARDGDRPLLDDMTLAGARYWGHDENHPEAYRVSRSGPSGSTSPKPESGALGDVPVLRPVRHLEPNWTISLRVRSEAR